MSDPVVDLSRDIERLVERRDPFLISVLESLDHPFYVVNAQNYTVEVANSAAWAEAQRGRCTCYALAHGRTTPCTRDDHPCLLEEIKRTRRPVTVEHVHYDRQGRKRYVEVRGHPLLDREGNVSHVIEYTLDITERKEAEIALQQTREAAEEAMRRESERRQEGERRRRVAESLVDILAVLNSNQSLEATLGHIAAKAMELLGNQAAAIYRQQGSPPELTLQAAQGLSSEEVSGADLTGREALRRAIGANAPIVVSDLAVAPGIEEPASRYQTLLAIPLTIKGEAYGGIVLYYHHPRHFSDDDLELAVAFSYQVALAIENTRLRDQVEQNAVLAERSRLARDLHDSVSQALFSASLMAEVLSQVWQRDPEEALRGLEDLRRLTRGALAEMRTLLLELRPAALMRIGLDELLHQLAEALLGRTQMEVVCNLQPVPPLPVEVHMTFYRVAQEALSNVIKHSGASHVSVGLWADPPISLGQADGWQGQVLLQVDDDGRGFDAERVSTRQLGLEIMRERAEAVGATLSLASRPGQGTQVTLIWRGG